MWRWAVGIVLGGLLLGGLVASPSWADDDRVPAAINRSGGHGFENFCSEWLRKLATNEKHNLQSARTEKKAGKVLLHYTGYEGRVLRCEARESGIEGSPYIGKLVYHEFAYRLSGKTRAAAMKATPEVLAKTEVMEIFRFDGRKWLY